MAPKCKPDVVAARSQTERMIRDAEHAIRAMPSTHAKALGAPKQGADFTTTKARAPRSAEHCTQKLESARVAFVAAEGADGALAQRDGYIRAAFQAGQALSCARVAKIGKKLGHMPVPKAPKKAKKS